MRTGTKIIARARDFGFDHAVFTRPRLPEKDIAAYLDWRRSGLGSGMPYMEKNAELRIDMENGYPGVQSVLVLGVSYYQGPVPDKPGPAYGRVARYAWGLDYHDVIRARLRSFLTELDIRAEIAVDTKPLLERALARSGGLGFTGKNTVLILPGNRERFHVGSWVFLTEILLDFPLPDDVYGTPMESKCGSCDRCLTACPTDAFTRPYQLDANKCIAYLTIENKGSIPVEMRDNVGDWIFGCDVCQDVCPFNARAAQTKWPEFLPEHGVGPWLSLRDVLGLRDGLSFNRRFAGTPLGRPKRAGLLRNACVAAGNSGDTTLLPLLEDCLTDSSPLVREHAQWAIEKLSSC